MRRNRGERPLPTWRRILRVAVLLIILDVVLCGAGVAVGGYELLGAQREVRDTGVAHVIADGPALRDRFGVAAVAFGLARLCWWPWRPLAGLTASLGPLRIVNAATSLLDLGADGSAAGAHALDGLLPVFAALRHGHHSSGDVGARLLQGLQQGHESLRTALADMGHVDGAWSALDVSTLPPSLQRRLLPIAHYLPTADDALRVALVAPDLLGATRRHDYLVVPQNPWDLRATGGFIGTTALLDMWHGHPTLTPQATTTVDSKRPGYIPPPLPLIVYEHFSNWFYRDANWSPDFPTSAALLREFYRRGQRRRTDGVIAFDSFLLGPLLEITGPVRVPGISVPLDAQHGVQVLDRYINYRGAVRKQFASAAYNAIFHRLLSLPISRLPLAMRALGTALQQRHLLLWLPDGTVAPILARHGWDGAIDPTRADYLYAVDTNVHYNKINELVHKSMAYRVIIGPDRSLRSTVTIAYTNTATPQNLPSSQDNTLYEDFVRLYVPLGSRLLSTSGLTQPWPVTREYNKTVFNGFLLVPADAHTHATVTFSYVVPPNALLDPTTYHLTVQKQPGTDVIPLSVELRAGAPDVRVGGSATWSWQGRQGTDLALTAPLTGGHAHPVPLVYDARPMSVVSSQ